MPQGTRQLLIGPRADDLVHGNARQIDRALGRARFQERCDVLGNLEAHRLLRFFSRGAQMRRQDHVVEFK